MVFKAVCIGNTRKETTNSKEYAWPSQIQSSFALSAMITIANLLKAERDKAIIITIPQGLSPFWVRTV